MRRRHVEGFCPFAARGESQAASHLHPTARQALGCGDNTRVPRCHSATGLGLGWLRGCWHQAAGVVKASPRLCQHRVMMDPAPLGAQLTSPAAGGVPQDAVSCFGRSSISQGVQDLMGVQDLSNYRAGLHLSLWGGA